MTTPETPSPVTREQALGALHYGDFAMVEAYLNQPAPNGEGVCSNYPNCPGGHMTTQVKITHNGGNHAVMVNVLNGDKRGPEPVTVGTQARLEKEGDETTAYVYGGQSIEIVEADD